ncbi:MAG TPA: ABC transporter ATP-binding protein [Gemmatimonadaceae bacterium]|nr:ABC transporter ATP-binding protein [Gemmatimonadaceae bacterium]
MMSEEPAVSVSSLGKRFGDVVALEGISFDVRRGELFGLIGPDGAGKTTLFRLLTTVQLPDSGTARVLGLDVVRDFRAIRARIGYMPGRFSLYADLSVEENLRFFASVFGTTVEAGARVIAPIYSQIARFADRRAGALSGGMKQKLALCCALVHLPELLLLDEPTTGVDAVSRREFWDLLETLRADGLTIVASTPYMDEAVRCERVALIQHGRILDVGDPRKIGARFDRPLFAVRGGDRVRLLRALRDHPHAHSVFPFGADVHFTDARADLGANAAASELRRHLAAQGFADAGVETIEPGIEDVFMALMQAAPRAA